VTLDAIYLHLFLFSLLGKAKQWFNANKDEATCNTLGSTKAQDVTNIPSHMPECENSASKPHHQSKMRKQQQEQNYD
jgi:hypothetical protein